MRAGYAFAQNSRFRGATPERQWVWESRRAWLWGLWLPMICLMSGLLLGPWGWVTCVIYPLQLFRQTVRNRGPLTDRVTLAFFHLLGRFPEALGQIKFLRDRLLGQRTQLIEYK